jgi:hypothetical protein
MKKILLAASILLCVSAQAQTVRYLDELFANVSVDSNVIYGQNKGFLTGFNVTENLKMDVYTPSGDTATSRPVIILMHAGSFLPGSVTGFNFADKNENCIVELCKRFAKRGYVAVSMTYRLGWNATAPDQETKSKTIINAVYRAMQDSKNCIRYFRSTYADSANKWGIDPNKFVLGGSNSGAYVAMAASSLNKPAELLLPKFLDINGFSFVDTTLTGNFDGFGGTQNLDNFAGYSSAFNCVLSLGGAAADTSLVEVGETPVIAMAGVSEQLTPYNTAVVVTSTLQPVIEVSGTGDFMVTVNDRGNNSPFVPNNFPPGPVNRNGAGVKTISYEGLYPFYGQAFEPWNWYTAPNPSINAGATMSKAMLYIDTIMGYSAPRLYKLLVDPAYGTPSSIYEVNNSVEMSIFPIPAVQELNVLVNSLQAAISNIHIYDVAGRVVTSTENPTGYAHTFDVSNLNSGSYFVRVQLQDGQTATRRISIQ